MKTPATTPATVRSPRAQVLFTSQLLFNVGFFAVVPFLAGVLRDVFMLGGAAVGLVLGIRTAAQQGAFLFGGALADRFGARALILVGCAVRVSGFATLAWSTASPVSAGPGGTRGWLALFVVGTVLTGLGGALFSPALELLVARAEASRPASGHRRATLFAVLAVFGEAGAAIGPVVGAMLLGWGFAAVAMAGAALFALIAVALALLLPPSPVTGPGPSGSRSPFAVVGDRRFLALAVFASVNLLSYNQLYLGLPVELERVGAGSGALAAMFVIVSGVTIALQIPVARLASRFDVRPVLRVGYLLLAASFAVLGLAAPMPAPEGSLALAPAAACTILLTLGHLVVGPTVLSLVPRFGPEHRWGSYYGLLATCGGVAVLFGNVVVGALYSGAAEPAASAALPWLVLAVLPVLSAVRLPGLIPLATQT